MTIQFPQGESIVMVANGMLLDNNLQLIPGCAEVLEKLVQGAPHFILAVKVQTDEQEAAVKQAITTAVPSLKPHHIIFYEQDSSVYNIARQFNSKLAFHSQKVTYDSLQQFIKSYLVETPLTAAFK